MSDKDNILVIIELDNSPHAIVDRAVRIAKLMDCELELLLCDPTVSALGDGFFVSNEAKEIGQKIRQAQEEMIGELAEDARKDGVTVTTDVLQERPVADGVLARALDSNPRFVMKGTQYHSIAERAILVDTDWQLIRHCPYPLWLVKPGDFREKPVIIASVDPTHEHDKLAALDQVIIDAAKSIAGPIGGDVHLFHTYQRLIGIGSEVNKTFKPIRLPIDEVDERMKKEHREALEDIVLDHPLIFGKKWLRQETYTPTSGSNSRASADLCPKQESRPRGHGRPRPLGNQTNGDWQYDGKGIGSSAV